MVFNICLIITLVDRNKHILLIGTEELKSIFNIYKVRSYKILSAENGKIILKAPLYTYFLIAQRMSMHQNLKIKVMPDKLDSMLTLLAKLNFKRIGIGKHILEDSLVEKLIKSKFILDLKTPEVIISREKDKDFYFLQIHYISNLGAEKTFLKRNPPYRPFSPSYTMDSRLARLAVNLSHAYPGCIFLDPFAGSGSFLMEAHFVGCTPIGIDISPSDLEAAVYNAKYFGAKINLIASDSTRLPLSENSVDSIATDPPYGRASRSTMKIEKLYKEFLNCAYTVLRESRYLTIYHPSTLDITKLAEKIGFIERFRGTLRVHKSLTRHISVFTV